ncbi:MAG TPA: hypothetical protein PKE32_08915 [Miltoncostaeaceae bacterium]|nr:hypothetical protein [Miltoncostaeaceae bacterium]
MTTQRAISLPSILGIGLLGVALALSVGPMTHSSAAPKKPCPAGKVPAVAAGKRVCLPGDSVKLLITPTQADAGDPIIRIAVSGFARRGVNLTVVRRPLVDRTGKRYRYKGCRAAAGGWAVLNAFSPNIMSTGIPVRPGRRFAFVRRGTQIPATDLPSNSTWQVCARLTNAGGQVVAVSNPQRIVIR